MRKVCDSYARSLKQPMPPPLAQVVVTPVDSALIRVAVAFTQLQDGRYAADYDHSAAIEFQFAAQLVDLAGDALDDFSRLSGRPDTTVFLTALLLADRWSRRG